MKITSLEFKSRKLLHFRKHRQRKKIRNKLDDLFYKYCMKNYGGGLGAALYGTYAKHFDGMTRESDFLKAVGSPSSADPVI